MFFRNFSDINSNGSVSINGNPIDAAQTLKISAQAVVTGTVTGTLVIQASNDVPPGGAQNMGFIPTNWTSITGAIVAIAGANTYLIPQIDTCYMWLRVSYTSTSGTGTLLVNTKTIGF